MRKCKRYQPHNNGKLFKKYAQKNLQQGYMKKIKQE